MAGCCCSTPIPPPTEELVGTWILNPESKTYDAGNGYYRYSNKYISTSFSHKICRLIITHEGWISFV